MHVLWPNDRARFDYRPRRHLDCACGKVDEIEKMDAPHIDSIQYFVIGFSNGLGLLFLDSFSQVVEV